MERKNNNFKIVGVVHTSKFSKQALILFALLTIILFIGIGYSAINSVTAEIAGEISTITQNGVFITDVEYVSGIEANLDASNIGYYKGTMLQSLIELSNQNPNSEIKYKVTIYNNSEETYPFVAVLYDKEFYDNPDIIFEISGFNIGETIGAKETKDLYITFKYKNQTIPEKTILSSYINFKIAEPNRMMATSSAATTDQYLRGTITKEQIEEIEFKQGIQPPEGIIESFDASEKKDGSIMAYYTDADGNGLYELTFLSDNLIGANIDASHMFQKLTVLTRIKFDNFSTYGTTNMSYMFDGCLKLKNLDTSRFDTRNVTNMSYMFAVGGHAESGRFVASVVSSSLTTLSLNNLNTEKVQNMSGMFMGCTELEELNLSGFNTSQVTDMSYMFACCKNLRKLDVSNFDTSSVLNMQAMFSLGFAQKTQLRYFTASTRLTKLNLSSFDTKNVLDMSYMFAFNSSLYKVYVSEYNSETNTGWTTTAVTSSSSMFDYCSELVGGNGTTCDSSKTDGTYAVIDTPETFGYLTNINQAKGLLLATDGPETATFLCSNVVRNKIERIEFKLGTDLPDGTIETFDASEREDGSIIGCYTDRDMNSLYELTFLSNTVIETVDLSYQFQNLTSLTQIKFDNFRTSSAVRMTCTFENCTNLEILDVGKFDTSKVRNMDKMFDDCSSLKTLNLSSFDIDNVTSMKYMFQGCKMMEILDINSFNTKNVSNMYYMFYNCTNLTTIYVSEFNSETNNGWTTTAVTDSARMFGNCTNLIGGNGTKINSSKTDKTYAVIDTPETPGYLTNIKKID